MVSSRCHLPPPPLTRSQSYHLVPPSSRSAEGPHALSHEATAHPVSGTHDAMRHGLVDKAKHSLDGSSVHALQNRLEQVSASRYCKGLKADPAALQWESTQRTLRLTLQRNTFGLGLPLRTMMDRKLVAQDIGFPAADEPMRLGGSQNVALEILDGKDERIDVADFMSGGEQSSHTSWTPADCLALGRSTSELLDIHAPMEKRHGIA